MPVGNDLVDLRDPGSQPDAIHPRFDSRVFTAHERRQIAARPDGTPRHALRWVLWAAKESTFKLVRQSDETVPFHPRSFEVRVASGQAAEAEVRFADSVYPVTLDVNTERVHAVATTRRASGYPAGVLAWEVDAAGSSRPLDDASIRVRRMAARAIGERLGIAGEEIEIAGRVPVAVRRETGTELPVDLSLSHHGRFVAHALLIRDDVNPRTDSADARPPRAAAR